MPGPNERQNPSAFAYALPLIIAIAVVGGFTAWKVSSAKPSIGVSEVDAGVAASVGPSSVVRPRWLKGQTHAHSNEGPDSIEPVESVLAYYADAGFDFVVLTDHNHVTVANGPPGLLVIPGAEITLTRDTCEPMPPGAEKCAMHMNALFADPFKAKDAFLEPPATSIFDVYRAELQTAKQLGALAVLNHPNYQYTAADPRLLVRLSNEGLRFVEVMNEAKELNSAGDATHPSVEKLWDEALTRGAKLYAIASDDAHNYSDAAKVAAEGRSPAVVNQGFIYVWATKDAQSIRAAMERGEFYASTGVVLEDVKCFAWSPQARTFECKVSVDRRHQAPVIRFIWNGRETASHAGHDSSLRVPPPEDAGTSYVRVIVEAEGKRALTQPFFVAE